MPKPNYSYAKRQREIAKKQKKEAKRRQKAEMALQKDAEATVESLPDDTAPQADSEA